MPGCCMNRPRPFHSGGAENQPRDQGAPVVIEDAVAAADDSDRVHSDGSLITHSWG